MELKSIKVFVMLFVLLALTQMVSSLNCYTCTTISSGSCGDQFDPTSERINSCGKDQDVCYKLIYAPEGMISTVHRGCGTAGICDTNMWTCTYCTDDVCNNE